MIKTTFICLLFGVYTLHGKHSIVSPTNCVQPKIEFTENKGQVSDQNYRPRPDIYYYGRTQDYGFFIKNNGISFQFYKIIDQQESYNEKFQKQLKTKTEIYRLDIEMLNCSKDCETSSKLESIGYSNYYLEVCPNGVHNVKSYGEVTLHNVYKKINLRYYQKNGNLKYDYIVEPGGNYKAIKLRVSGADKMLIQQDGSLLIETPFGKIVDDAPKVFQNSKQLKANWVLSGNDLSFKIEEYDSSLPLIIDPLVRAWGSFYGGWNSETVSKCENDLAGNVYFCGTTDSNNSSAIATTGAHQISCSGNEDGFLVKMANNGVRLWGTYYGTSGVDEPNDCEIDPSGFVYICGNTNSSLAISTPGSHQQVIGGNYDAFLIKFDAFGVRQWGTYYGGLQNERGYGCAIDNNSNVFLCGQTDSNNGSNIIATPGSHQNFYAATIDAFLVKFNSGGTRLWGTYYGDTITVDKAYSCATDKLDNIYLVGSSSGMFETGLGTPGSFQPTLTTDDAFAAKFNSSGVRIWGTYYGGAGTETAYECKTDTLNNLYFMGVAGNSTVIATPGSHQQVSGGNVDCFLAKFNSNGSRLWATYYGGSGDDWGSALAIDKNQNSYIAGNSNTYTGTAIATPGGYQPTFGGGVIDAFLVNFDPNGIRKWGTYYGGVVNENGTGCSVDTSLNIFLVGWNWGNSPSMITLNGHQPYYGGGITDGYITKFKDCSSQIFVNPGPNQSICSGNNATLFANASGQVDWYTSPFSTTTIATGTSYTTPTLTTGTNSTSVTYYAASSNTCMEIRMPVEVSVNPIPVITAASGTICSGNNFSIVPSGALNYNITGGQFNISPSVTTSYSVTGSNVYGCVSNTPAVVVVTVYPTPSLTIVSSANPICYGDSVVLSANGALTYTWVQLSLQGSTISVSPVNTSTYTLIGSSANSCTNTIQFVQVVNVCTKLEEQINSHKFPIILPNPFDDIILLEFNGQDKHQIQIFSMLGQLVYSGIINENHNQTKIDLSFLNNGVYFLKSGDLIKKIIKNSP